MIVTWAFIMLLTLPSFGGEVRAVITAKDEESCVKLRKMVLSQAGGEKNLNGTASQCLPTEPLKPEVTK